MNLKEVIGQIYDFVNEPTGQPVGDYQPLIDQLNSILKILDQEEFHDIINVYDIDIRNEGVVIDGWDDGSDWSAFIPASVYEAEDATQTANELVAPDRLRDAMYDLKRYTKKAEKAARDIERWSKFVK